MRVTNADDEYIGALVDAVDDEMSADRVNANRWGDLKALVGCQGIVCKEVEAARQLLVVSLGLMQSKLLYTGEEYRDDVFLGFEAEPPMAHAC